MNFDPKDFRRALGKFPTGVTVITTRDKNGERIGVTASSFNSVSIDPALVLWSIDKGAYSLDAFSEGSHFAVNVLRNDQVELSNRFARRGEDKFAGIEVREGIGGCPLLPDTAAVFECRTWNLYEGGDHLIVVGEVLNYGYEDNASSLVFHSGRYAVPEVHPAVKAPAESQQDKGLIRVEDECFVLTERGAEVVSQLLDMAIEHERQTLACLSESQQLALKDSLKSLFEALR